MNRHTQIKFGLAAIGIVVWGYGARVDNAHLRLAGMGVVGLALIVRFMPRSWRDRLDGRASDGGAGPTDTHP